MLNILTCGILDPGNFCSWNPGILGFGIRNPAKDRIRNPSSTDKESGLQYMDPESMAWNPKCKTVLDFFSRGDLNIKEHPLLFSFHLPPFLQLPKGRLRGGYLTPRGLWNHETSDTMNPMKPRDLWHHETYETTKSLTPRNLWNHENIDTTKPMKPKTWKNETIYTTKPMKPWNHWHHETIHNCKMAYWQRSFLHHIVMK